MDGNSTEAGSVRMNGLGKRPRRRWSAAEKAQIVREAVAAGAVKQEVAARHGVHVSALSRWRHELRGAFPPGEATQAKGARLLPIEIRAEGRPSRPPVTAAAQGSVATQPGAIAVEFSGGRRLSIHGAVESGTLRTVLQELSRS